MAVCRQAVYLSSLTPHQAISIVGTMMRIDQIRKGMIMATPFGKRVAQDKAAAHRERLLIPELEEIRPISAVTRPLLVF